MRRHLLLVGTAALGACAASAPVSHMSSAGMQPVVAEARPGSELPSLRESHDVGTFARSYQPQLHFCYSEGRRLNPTLAGAATVSVRIAGNGDVLDVAIIDRSWTGRGVPEAESCLRDKIRAWKFPPAEGGDSRHSFSLIFTS